MDTMYSDVHLTSFLTIRRGGSIWSCPGVRVTMLVKSWRDT